VTVVTTTIITLINLRITSNYLEQATHSLPYPNKHKLAEHAKYIAHTFTLDQNPTHTIRLLKNAQDVIKDKVNAEHEISS